MTARRIAFLGLAFALCAAAGLARAQAASEAAVKAAFLYKFAGYVEWPPGSFAGPQAPFVIGVHGSPEVAAELERLVPQRSVHNRPIVVRRLPDGQALQGVHLLFMGRGQADGLLREAARQGVLTVGESDRALDQGAMINFVTAEDRVGFEVSVESAERAGLRISSRMLAVARRVVGRG